MQRHALVGEDDFFHSGFAFRSFRDADEKHLMQSVIGEDFGRDTHLPFAARRAETLLGKAAQFYGENGAYGFRAQVLLDLATLHRAKKRKAKTLACLTEAEPLFEKAGAEVFLQQTRDLLAALQ